MPYIEPGFDFSHIPNWAEVYPDRHARWLDGSKQNKLRMHLMSFGDKPGYQILRGKTLEETREIAEKLGLSELHVDDATNRIVYGDLILAWIPRAEHERRRDSIINEQRRMAERDARGETYVEQFETNPDLQRKGIRPVRRQLGEHLERSAHAQGQTPPQVSLAGIDPPKSKASDKGTSDS